MSRRLGLAIVAAFASAIPMTGSPALDGQAAPMACQSSNADQVERWREHIAAEASRGFSGTVLVADGPATVFAQAYGATSWSTRFWIASISKALTATAVMRLVDDGRLRLDAPIGAYLDGVPPAWAHVTAHHLLSHRAGLPHAYAADRIADRREALRALLSAKSVTPLGAFAYSNDGYNVLAIVLEVVSGRTFEDAMRQFVFEPAGMAGAGLWGFEPAGGVAPPARGAAAGRRSAEYWRSGHSIATWGFRGATGICATAEDLLRFVTAFRDGRLVRPETVRQMLASKNPNFGPSGQTYGYGWALRLQNGAVDEYWHAGNEDWLGHTGVMHVAGKRTSVILSNSGDVQSESWAHRIEQGLAACARPARAGVTPAGRETDAPPAPGRRR
jgi:CubicO group peptidase (beta-lactamase class C family)